MIGLNKLGANDVAYGTKPQQTAVYEFANADGIKNVINSLLFDHRMDSVLVNYNNQLFVCEVTDMNGKRYAKKMLTYHPLGDKVSL
jgi:hypothetical protein